MSRIQLNDTVIDILGKMSDGNPGAATVLITLYGKAAAIDPQDFMGGLGSILALDTHKIYGSDIWVLYKNICGHDYVNMCAVLRAIQLGIIPERDVKDAIRDIQEGREATQLHLPTIVLAVMDRLEEFNRMPKEETPNVPPSYFMKKGIPSCSMWGKSEIECLAWAYVTGMALDVGPDIDTWHPVTAERCLELIQHDDRAMLYAGHELRGAIGGYLEYWDQVTKQLVDAAGAFEVGGLAWNKHQYDKHVAAESPQEQPA